MTLSPPPPRLKKMSHTLPTLKILGMDDTRERDTAEFGHGSTWDCFALLCTTQNTGAPTSHPPTPSPSSPGTEQPVSNSGNSSNKTINHQKLKIKRNGKINKHCSTPLAPAKPARGYEGTYLLKFGGQGKAEPKSWKHTNEGEKKIKNKGL